MWSEIISCPSSAEYSEHLSLGAAWELLEALEKKANIYIYVFMYVWVLKIL